MEAMSYHLVNLTEQADHDHDNDHEDTSSINLAKVVAMAVLFCASMIFGLLPFFLARTSKWHQLNKDSNVMVSTLLAFGGGVLLSTTLLHMLPEISETISYLEEEKKLPTFVFSLAPFLMACGFFVIYFVEELVHVYLHSHQKKAINHIEAFTRGRSSRESLHAPRNSVENPNSLTTVSTAELVSDHHVHHSHNHSHSHHSHIPDIEEGDFLVNSIRGLLIVLALSVHELFEGLAVGLESTTASVWYMFGAVAAHKLVNSFYF